MPITGCKFSREYTRLSFALVEVQNTGRVWGRQKNVRGAGGAMTTTCAGSLPVLCGLSSGLLVTYIGIYFHYFNRLCRSEKLATSYWHTFLLRNGSEPGELTTRERLSLTQGRTITLLVQRCSQRVNSCKRGRAQPSLEEQCHDTAVLSKRWEHVSRFSQQGHGALLLSRVAEHAHASHTM